MSDKIKSSLQLTAVAEMKKEQDSQLQLNSSASKMKMHKNLSKQYSKEFDFDPFHELGIQLNKSDPSDQQELQKLIGMYLVYPSTEFAQLHAQAMKLGNYDLQTKEDMKTKISQAESPAEEYDQSRKVCPCCGFVCQKESIKFCTSFDDIKNIGTSTYLFFYTFKNLSILLGIMAVVYSIFSIVTNAIAAGASASTLYNVDYISISLAAKQQNDTAQNRLYYFIQCWLGMVVVLVWALVLIGIKYNQIKSSIQYDNDTSSCSDYSIVIEGIPLDVTKEELQKQLDAYYNLVVDYQKVPEARRRPFKIASMNVGKPFYLQLDALRNDDLKELNKQIEEDKQKFVEWVMERRDRPTFSVPKAEREATYKRYQQAMVKRVELLAEQAKKIKQQLIEENSDHLTTIFITFETNLAQKLMTYLNQRTIYSRIKGIFGDKNRFEFKRGDKTYPVNIATAPEPEDIVWSNIGLEDCSIYLRKIFTYTFTLALLGGSFGIVYALSVQQNKLTANNDPNDSVSRYLSIAISLVIAIINAVLVQVIKLLTKYESDYTATNFQASLAVKATLAQMINSIIIPVIVARYIKNDIYSASGLVDNIFMMSFSIAFVGPIIVFFDPVNYMAMAIRCLKRRLKSKLYQNQREHNQYHEGVEFEVGYESIYTVNLFMFVCFYVSLQPICVFTALLGYLMMYWVQKYCMFYRYKRPVPATDFVNQALYQIIHFGPFMYSLGSLTWSNFMPGGIPEEAIIPNLIALGFSVLIFIVPMKLIIIGCFFDEEAAKPTVYEEERITFSTEYDRLNPTTQEEATIQYNKYCEKYVENFKKMSTEKQAQIARKKKNNDERGQLNMNQAAGGQFNAFAGLGGQNTANLFAGLIQPQMGAPNPYQAFNAFHHAPGGQQQQPQANPLMGMMGGMAQAPQPQQQQRAGPQAQTNAFASLFGGAAPGTGPAQMGGMGGMMGGPRPLNPIMGMQPGYTNQMAMLGMGFGGGGYRMW